MLVELHIENLGVIERAALAFGSGFGALTGETGAGKTMLVEAIGLLVGGRADPSVVRSGATEARVDGRFQIDRGGEPVEIVLSRVVPADGRSRAYVNGRPTTVASLADEARSLVDLHGQHAHQSLMEPAAQRDVLDRFGGVDLAPLRQARARVTEIDAELAALGGDERARAREIDLLRYQVDELDRAAIDDPDEDVRLSIDEATLADAVGHRIAGGSAVELIRGDDVAGTAGADGLIRSALAAIDGRPPFESAASRLGAIATELDDVAHDLRATAESIDDDPERLAVIRERRQLLVELRRKYGEDLGDVMAFHRDAADRLRELLDFDRRAAELDRLRVEAHSRAEAAAKAVGRARRRAAPDLAVAVERRLRELAMPDAAVTIEVGGVDRDIDRDHERGSEGDHERGSEGDTDVAGDRVRIMLSANPGSPMLALQRVASGGELARTMLALRLALTAAEPSDSDAAPAAVGTIVFDEVDAGIGGNAAIAVGEALADLAATHQVLVVTHLAQVGARASTHHVVTKHVANGRTYAEVAAVEGDARVDEVARMLAGTIDTEARSHAAALLSS